MNTELEFMTILRGAGARIEAQYLFSFHSSFLVLKGGNLRSWRVPPCTAGLGQASCSVFICFSFFFSCTEGRQLTESESATMCCGEGAAIVVQYCFFIDAFSIAGSLRKKLLLLSMSEPR